MSVLSVLLFDLTGDPGQKGPRIRYNTHSASSKARVCNTQLNPAQVLGCYAFLFPVCQDVHVAETP